MPCLAGRQGLKAPGWKFWQGYRIAIRDLDGVLSFDAVSCANGLGFNRNGIQETIIPGTGSDTGMKWLQDKTNCLVAKPGEGIAGSEQEVMPDCSLVAAFRLAQQLCCFPRRIPGKSKKCWPGFAAY